MDKAGHICTAYHLNKVGYNLLEHYKIEKPLLKKSRQLYAGQYKTVFNKRQLAWAPNTTFHHHMSLYHLNQI